MVSRPAEPVIWATLVSIVPESLRVNTIDLLANRLYLIGHPNIELGGGVRRPGYLKKHPIIFRESGSGTRQAMERYLRGVDIELSPRLELTSNEAVKQAVMAGLGLSIMPLIGIRNELQLGQLRIVPLSGLPIQTTWQLIWLRGKRLSPAGEAFVEYLKGEREQTVRERFGWTKEY